MRAIGTVSPSHPPQETMKTFKSLLLIFLGFVVPLNAQETSKQEQTKPIRGLLITGGCCHDYDAQKNILMNGIGDRIAIKWDYVYEQFDGKEHQIAIYNDPNWAMGYDIVVHNECYGGVTDDAFVNRIVEGHIKAGAAAIFLHCSMHSYRAAKSDEYRKLIGVSSFNHGSQKPITLKKLTQHPVIDPLPEGWVTPNGELYNTNPKTHPNAKVWDSATALAEGSIPSTAEPQVCIWLNEYQGIRAFGTTLGHHNETMSHPIYLDLVTRGLLWTLGKLE
jgi:uncharacterized protein